VAFVVRSPSIEGNAAIIVHSGPFVVHQQQVLVACKARKVELSTVQRAMDCLLAPDEAIGKAARSTSELWARLGLKCSDIVTVLLPFLSGPEIATLSL
jgi:hypothetical protein